MRFLQPQLDVSREPVAGPVNWWEEGGATGAVAVYQPKGAASLAASYTDLSGNGNDAAPGVAPTWAAGTGWTFNGTSQYLTTGIAPQSDQDQAMIVQYSGASTGYFCGIDYGFNKRFFLGKSATVYDYANGRIANGSVSVASSGNICVSNNAGYFNGSPDAAGILGWGAAIANSIYIGCRNNAGVPGNFIAANIQAIAIYNTTLTGPQVAAVTTAMQLL